MVSHSSLGLGMSFFRISYFFIIIDKTINKSPSKNFLDWKLITGIIIIISRSETFKVK